MGQVGVGVVVAGDGEPDIEGGAATTGLRRLVLTAAVVVRWSMDLDLILLCLTCFVLPMNLYIDLILLAKKPSL